MDQEQDRHVTVALDRPPALAPDLHLRPYQQEAVDAVLGAWGSNIYRPAVVHATGLGKDLADDTEIPVPGGFTRMGDLRVGDEVFSVDGTPTRIVGVYPQGERLMYRVEFTDGAVIHAGAGHLWTVHSRRMKPTTMTTSQIMQQGRYRSKDGWLWRVPVVAPVQHPYADLPLDPYLVGALLANGYIPARHVIQLTTPDLEVIEELRRRGVEVRDATRETSTCPQWSLPGLSAVAREVIGARLSATKRIPPTYLHADSDARLDLLRGLMDGDGSSRAGGRRSATYHTISEGLAEDVAEVVWSLGGSASVSKYDRTREDKPIEFQVHILMPVGVSPFLTRRKQGRDEPRRQFAPKRAITSITPTYRAHSTCIEVAHPSKLFAAGRRYVMTHNTVTLSGIVAEAYARGLRTVIVAHRHELLEQIVGTLHRMLPGVIVGVVAAQRREYSAPVVVASLPTIAKGNHVDKLLPRQVVIQDECHRAMAPTYIRALERLGVGPQGPAFYVGVTATLRREDGTSVAELVDEVVHERDLAWAIEHDFLVPPTGLTVQIPGLRLDKVRTIAGDFSQGALDEAIAAAADAIVHAVTAHAADRRMIVFVPGVAAAAEVAEALTDAGFAAEAVTGDMPMDERRPVYERFRRGETRALVTVQVLTEGADFPMCDCAVIARPTKSRTLYAQIVGRAVRSYTNPLTGEKKTDALVLDITGVARVHGLLNLTDLYGAAKRRKVEVDEDGNVGDAEDMTDADLEDEGAGAAPPPKPQRHGPQEFERIDLFTGAVESEYVWLTTPSGIPFLSSTERVVFLWEAPMAAPDGSPGWWIGTRSLVSPSNGPAGWVLDLDTPPATVGSEMFLSTVSSDWSTHDWRIEAVPPGDPLEAMPVALPSNEAMELAEKLADTLTNTPIRRSAGWRSKSAPSDAQIGLARSLRIPEPELMSRARLSDEITTVKVARLIDPNGARR